MQVNQDFIADDYPCDESENKKRPIANASDERESKRFCTHQAALSQFSLSPLQESTFSGFDYLPNEMLDMILAYLSPQQREAIKRVNRLWECFITNFGIKFGYRQCWNYKEHYQIPDIVPYSFEFIEKNMKTGIYNSRKIDAIAQNLTLKVATNPICQQIYIYQHQINTNMANKLTLFLQEQQIPTELFIKHNSIDTKAAFDLLTIALCNHQHLMFLDLSQNGILDQHAVQLADILKHNKSLTYLRLSQNKLGAKGAQQLAQALQSHKSLTMLNLEGNDIDSKGALWLAEALKTNRCLKLFNLSDNFIGDQGTKQLAELLTVNATLEQLDLAYNNIYSEGTAYPGHFHSQNLTFISCKR